MAAFDPDHDETDLPDLDDCDDVIWFLEQNDVPLPDGLTLKKSNLGEAGGLSTRRCSV